ncbi:iron-sulfur cluster assembly protein [Dyadobacter jejuensis]|uniref:Iron-sulfur cluster assembly protein n=1 Tax=Dyadobacter jejuensis TaxID=1082580 RepID=A0A316ANP4_9BACT|nr:iron-sulfur cluster assembly accessory protein [Dyadobacter jejuensis]PWJ58754.1 iron-sulfur cluster assembly protein [Dyadobacter jejuensis]
MQPPITITSRAQNEITSTLKANKIPDEYGLRVGIKGGACSGSIVLGFDTRSSDDLEYAIDGIRVFIDKKHLMYVLGVSVDYEEGLNGSGYTVSTLEKQPNTAN